MTTMQTSFYRTTSLLYEWIMSVLFTTSYYIQFIWSHTKNMMMKYGLIKDDTKYLLRQALLLKTNGDDAFIQQKYKNALQFYSKRLYILSSIHVQQQSLKKHVLNQQIITSYDITATYIKLNDWNVCIKYCIDTLNREPNTRKLFEMVYDKLVIKETTKLLLSLNDNDDCDVFNNCYFNFEAIQYFCEQNGKCCAAATISSALNVILKQKRLNTEHGLNVFIDLYPKYRKRLLFRSTKNIGNGNLKKGLKFLAKNVLNIDVSIKTLISGPKCKCKGIRIVTKDELKSETNLVKYKKFIIWYLMQDNNVLLAHIKNHYCLVFAIRENPNNGLTEVLIAKKGQNPKDWEPLNDFLMCFAKSKIYKLFVICQRELTII